MELIWKELNAVRLISQERTQARVAGHLPTPDGRTPLEVLSCGAKAIVESTSFETDEITLKGRVEVTVSALDESAKVFAFESKAAFEHKISVPGASPGMSAEAVSCIQSISAVPADSGVGFEADVDFFVMVTSSVPMKVTGGVTGVNDLEIKTAELTHSRKIPYGSSTIRMREEIAAEGVAEVISAEGQISVREVTVEQGAASVSGVISVSAVTADSNGRTEQIYRMIPFRERIGINALDGSAYCEAVLNSLYLRALGEDFALISMEAEVSFSLFGIEKADLVVPVDAFSPTIGFDCLTERTELIDYKGFSSNQTAIKETIVLPDNSAEMERPLFVSVRPIVTEANVGESGTEVSGILSTSLAYLSTAGRIYSFTEDIPFSVPIDNEYAANMPIVIPSCISSVTGSADRSVQVQYNLILNSNLYDRIETEIAAGLAEKELNRNDAGIVICLASKGEGFFDVAKRYSVSCSSVRELNPDVSEPFSDGEKLILLR